MTNRERVLASLSHQQPDKTPYHIDFTQKAHAKMVQFYGDPNFASDLGNCFTFLSTEPPTAWKEVAPDIWQDQFGVHWDRSVDKDIGVVVNCLVNADNVDDFEFPDPNDPARYANYPKQPSIKEDRFVISTISFSLFERAWTLAGMENLLIAMCADKPFAHRLLERVLEFNLAVIDHACSYGVDAMHFGDDWGQQRGLLTGYGLWKEFIEPCLRAQYKAVKDRGKVVVIHSCGKVDELFPDLIEDGLDVFNPFQPEVIDVFDAKKRYGDRLSFYGGISTQRTLPYAAVSEVKEEIKRLIDKVGKNGGYFAAPAHSIPADAKPENIAAMIEVLQNQ